MVNAHKAAPTSTWISWWPSAAGATTRPMRRTCAAGSWSRR